ncbi:hypothetical protein [Streptomyces sp. NPDC060001]|uniref:hypothetical protein n=1 Tax=Streptomyces sp. NPDC060001 TaxID=3347032 RepID=UPI0036C04D7B
MSQWNLSVRLDGQGSGLARTLRRTADDARAADRAVVQLRRDISLLRQQARHPIRLRVRVDAGNLRSDVQSALTAAGDGQGITARLSIDAGQLRDDVRAALTTASGQALAVRLDVDGGHLRDDVNAALTAAASNQGMRVRLDVDAGHLRDDVDAALTAAGAGQGLGVRLALTDTMQLRRDVEDAVRWAAWGHRITIPIGLADPMQLRRDVSAAVRWASMNQTITVRVRADTSSLGDLTNTLNAGGGGGSSGGLGGALKGLLLLAPAALPLLAGLSTSLAPLPGQFAAAIGPAAAFGIALAGQIEPLSQAAEAEKKYQEAVRTHGKSSAEAMQAQLAYQQILADMPPEAQRAAVALSQLKGNFSDWSDEMTGFTMEPLTKGITVLDTIIPRMTPHVETASAQLNRLADVAGGAVTTPGFDAMADRFADFTDRQLDDMTDGVIHFLRVLSEGDVASNGPIGAFMDYAKQNGPAAREALSAISAAVVTLVQGAAEAGPGLLTVVTALSRLVAALPPELVGIIIQVAAGLKLLQLAGAGMAVVAAGVGRVGAQIAALSATSAAAGGGLAGLSAAFATLGRAAKASIIVAGIAAVVLVLKGLSDIGKDAPPDVEKLTTSLGKLGQTGKVTGEALRAFGPDLDGLGDSLRTLSRPSNLDKTQQFLTKLVGMDSTPVKDAKKHLDAVDKSLANLVQGGKGEIAAQAFDRIAAAMRKQGMSGKELRAQLGDYRAALADQKFEQELAAQSMGLFGQAALDTSAKLAAQKASADGLRQAITALNDVNRAAGSAMSAFEQSIDDATAAAKEHASALTMRDGELDLGSQKARDAEKVLSGLAANTDAAATAAREQGRSWEYVTGIQERGRAAFIDAAAAMGLSKAQAEALASSYLKIPDKKSTTLEMRTEDAISGLNSVIAAIQKTPNAKSVTVKALTADAVSMLESLGFTVKRMPDGRFKVTAETGNAKSNVAALQAARDALKSKSITLSARDQASAIARSIQSAINAIRGKTVTLTTVRQTINVESTAARNAKNYRADGGVFDYYADGGIQRGGVRHFANGKENHVAQIERGGAWRVWAEDETQGESYIPLARSKRPRSRAIAEETVRRLGGNPEAIEWNANGNVTDWRYDPSTGSLYSASDAGSAGNKTRKVKVKGKTKEIDYFDIGAVEKKLKSASKATQAWNKDLEKVADRVGGDVAEALAGMGKEGVALAKKMANGSTKYINEMAAALRGLQKTAKASLTDYTRQLGTANKLNKEFSDDLAQLAALGYGDLAKQLAAQNDTAAQQLADAAVKDKGKASSANAAAKAANNALTGDQVEELVSIIAAVKSKTTGIHDVAATTGLGEDVIIATATKATGQIKSALGGRADRFLADLAKAQKGMAYANGGIRAGLYATRGGAVTFAEPSTGGEAYIPLGANKRRHALPVLSNVASRFGKGLTDAGSGRVVIIREQGPLVGSQTWQITTGGNAEDTARKVDADNGFQLRTLARGGVRARG